MEENRSVVNLDRAHLKYTSNSPFVYTEEVGAVPKILKDRRLQGQYVSVGLGEKLSLFPLALRSTECLEEGTNVFVVRLNFVTGLRLNGYIARVAMSLESQNWSHIEECEQLEEPESIEWGFY